MARLDACWFGTVIGIAIPCADLDLPDVTILRDWITKMAPALDGGGSDASDDAAGVVDAAADGLAPGPLDAATGANDASANDAGADDASDN
jgi:hypothetical protein